MRMELKIGRESVTVKENLMDRIVRWFDPVKGQQRFQAWAMASLAGGYIGASRSRRALSLWTTRANDADTDTFLDLPTLRSRSRDLIRNAPLASGAINTVCTNAVGTGIFNLIHLFLSPTSDSPYFLASLTMGSAQTCSYRSFLVIRIFSGI